MRNDVPYYGQRAPRENAPEPRQRPDIDSDPAAGAGWYLQRERERRGLSLQAASRATGIHPHHLRAIECGMLENLPDRETALKMIGAYAAFLGFDAQPLVAHFAACFPHRKASSARIVAFPLLRRLRAMGATPAGMGAAVFSVMVLFGGLAWLAWPGAGENAARTLRVAQGPKVNGTEKRAPLPVKERPARKAIAARATDDKAVDPIAALITRTIGEESAAGERLPAPDMAPAAAPAAATGQAREQGASGQETGDTAARAAATVVRPLSAVPRRGLALRAVEQIWVRLEDDNGVAWFSGFLKPGEVLLLPQDRMLRLTAGDVHRLEWYANGRPMGRLGKRGADYISQSLKGLYRESGVKRPGARSAG